jgi:oxygen-independent coproporphyrinogen-3 oxidase
MLRAGAGAMRRANTDGLNSYLGEQSVQASGPRVQQSALIQLEAIADSPEIEAIGPEQGFEEALFLGLRMNEGIDLGPLRDEFGEGLTRGAVEALGDVEEAGLVQREGSRIRLTARGRMASNEVFSRLLVGVLTSTSAVSV